MIGTQESVTNTSSRLGDPSKGNLLQSSTASSVVAATTGLRDFIAFEFTLVPEVEYVFTALREENEVFYVWIVTNEFQASVRERIYAHQQAIIDEFVEFEFDFYILARGGRDIGDLIGDESIHLTYARE